MKRKIFSLFLLIMIISGADKIYAQDRTVTLLESGWRFIKKDVSGAELQDCDDTSWEEVCVPHDWAIRGNFDMNIDIQYVKVIEDGDQTEKLRTGRTGALPMSGVGWYRKDLPIAGDDRDKRIYVEFDGAMRLAKVFLNG